MLYWQRKSHSTWTAAGFNAIPARYFIEVLDHMRGYTSGSYAQLRFWRDMLNPGILDPGVSQETSALDHVPRSHTQLAEWGTPESSSRLYDITREPAGSCFGGGGWGRGVRTIAAIVDPQRAPHACCCVRPYSMENALRGERIHHRRLHLMRRNGLLDATCPNRLRV